MAEPRYDSASWSQGQIERSIRAEAGPHLKWEAAISYIARLFSGLWEARQLNLQRIDDLNDKVRRMEARIGDGETKVRLARAGKIRLEGDCHNSRSPHFTVSSDDTCPGWVYGPMPGEAGDLGDA